MDTSRYVQHRPSSLKHEADEETSNSAKQTTKQPNQEMLTNITKDTNSVNNYPPLGAETNQPLADETKQSPWLPSSSPGSQS